MKIRIVVWLGIVAFAVSVRAQPAEPKIESPVLTQLSDWLAKPRENRGESSAFDTAKLSKADAEKARDMLWADHVAAIGQTRDKEWKDQAITIGQHTLRLKERHFGNKPKDGWNLFISMHGGGGAPAEVNDQQWENQIRLYQPKDSLYIAPRAPTNNWNLWHEQHIDALFDRLIEDAIVLGEANPNRVYIMGYSAGGDGVYQLAPRMADRWAAASMMAGHPNDASPLGLRNLPFAIHVGALDSAYNRNHIAEKWGKELDALQAADPDGYTHVAKLHEGRSHWMNLEDAVAVEWMAGFTRDPIPKKVVWKQAGRTHERFYWLAVPAGTAKGGALLVVSRDRQTIEVEKAEDVDHCTIMLNDGMVDLDQPVTVRMNGREIFKGIAPRTIHSLEKTLAERGDPYLCFPAEIPLTLAEREAQKHR